MVLGMSEMRLATFAVLALFLSVATGLVAAVAGYGLGRALITAIAVLIVLQIAYFCFLLLKTALGKPGGGGASDDH